MSTQATTVRNLLATLVAAGLKHLVVSPGSRSTPLVQAAAERPELTVHVVLDERAAGFFALGLARATHTLVGTLCTSGSAVAHVLPAAIEATESGDALVAITADRPVTVRGLGAPQAILQPGLLAPYAAYFAEIDAQDPDVAARLLSLQRALQALLALGGVAHVNVPLALPLALTPDAPALLPPIGNVVIAPPGDPLPPPQPGERILLLAGPLRLRADLPAFLNAHLPRHQVAVLAEPASGLRDQLASLRHADAFLRDATVRAALLPDRIVRIGAWPVSKGAQLLLEDAKRLGIPVDAVQPRRVSDPLRQNRVTLTDDVATALRDWPLVQSQPETPWVARWRAIDAAIPQPAGQWHEAAAVAALASSLPPDSTLLLGNSMPVRDWDSFATPLPQGVGIEVSRGAAGIDGALATIAGLAVGGQRPLTAYLGDCTFLHDVGSLQVLAGQQLRHGGVRICVADNDGGAIFDYLPARAAMPEPLHVACFTTPHGLDLAAIARGFGIEAQLCGDLATWQALLAQPVPPNSVQVLVARFNRSVSEALHHDYWRQAATAAHDALGTQQ